jgi:hypothetical protein
MNHLYVLWTNADPLTSEKMVFMYTLNSKLKGWWPEVTLIIWGATAKYTAEDEKVQDTIKTLIRSGVKVSACKACADQLGVTDILEGLGVEVIYWGVPLTEVLKSADKLITI